MKYLLFLLCIPLFTGSCVAPGRLPYKRPLFVPHYQYKILKTEGQFRSVSPFDWNGDGEEDLFLVGAREILCFLAGETETPHFRLYFPQDICGFDITRRGGQKAWLVVLTTGRVILFNDVVNTCGKEIGVVTPEITSLDMPPGGRSRFFCDLDRDGLEDLVIPFGAGGGWHVQVYLNHGTAFVLQGTVALGGTHLSVPKLYLVPLPCGQEMLVEEGGFLSSYRFLEENFCRDRPCLKTSLAEVVSGTKTGGPPWNVMGISQLNRIGEAEVVIGSPQEERVWVWVDRKLVYALEIPGMLNLSVAFEDLNGDGWEDILCFVLKKPQVGKMLASALAMGCVPIVVQVYSFWNQEGAFLPRASQVTERVFWVSYPPLKSVARVALLLEDINSDGLLDGIALDSGGRLNFYYNVLHYLPEKRPLDFLEHLLKPVYRRLLQIYWPGYREDFGLKIPGSEGYWGVEPILISRRGRDDNLVVHYKSPPFGHDLIVVVFSQFNEFLG